MRLVGILMLWLNIQYEPTTLPATSARQSKTLLQHTNCSVLSLSKRGRVDIYHHGGNSMDSGERLTCMKRCPNTTTHSERPVNNSLTRAHSSATSNTPPEDVV